MTPVLKFPGRRKGRPGKFVRWLIGIAAALVALALVWLVWFSPVFDLRTVRISGTRLLSEDEVTRVAGIPLGTPLARLDYNAITQRVQTLPEIAHVEVLAQPMHGVHVKIQERTAVYVADSRGKRWLVDAQGHAFHEATGKSELLAVVVGSEERPFLADVAQVVTALPASLREGASIEAKTPHSINVNLTGGRLLRWGDARESALKAQVADKLVAAVKAREYDVSSPSRPVTR